VKRHKKIIFTLAFILPSVFFGIILTEPVKARDELKRKMSPFQERERDPFRLPEGIRLLSKIDSGQGAKRMASTSEGQPTDISPPRLKVKAILISDHIRLASIDQHIVAVGDLIHDERVLEIQSDRVILGKGDRKRTLLLSQSHVQLTVEETQGEK
jgi:hypothetical protein